MDTGLNKIKFRFDRKKKVNKNKSDLVINFRGFRFGKSRDARKSNQLITLYRILHLKSVAVFLHYALTYLSFFFSFKLI